MNRIISKGVLALALSLSTLQAYALPLLSQNVGQTTVNALTLYPDHQDSNLYYYMPNSSTMAREQSSGLPMFGFTYWGLGSGAPLNDAGAYMVFSMRLSSDTSQTEALRSAINTGHRVAVLPLKASTINLTAATPGTPALAPLFKEFDFALHAGMAEDEVGVNAILTGIGAKVFKAAVDNPALLKLDYCYKVEGLGPDFDGSIHVDWEHVYTDFQAHASVNGFWHREDISTEVERLRQQGAIKITLNGGTAKDEDYVRNIAERIVERLFKSDLSNNPTSGGGGGGWSFTSLELKYTDRRELKTEDYQIVRRQLEEREFCVPLMLSDIRAHKDQLVRNAD